MNRFRRSKWAAGLAGAVMAGSLVAAFPTVASAMDTDVVVSNGTGGTVTLDEDHVHPGDTIQVRGTGFFAQNPSGSGMPVLAMKINGEQYEGDGPFKWSATGPSVVDPDSLNTQGGSDGYAAIAVAADGTFSADVTVPADWQPTGRHFLTFLGGTLSTAQSGGKVLAPQSFNTPFAVLADDEAYAEVTSVAHAQDSKNTQSLDVSLRNFKRADGTAGQKVALELKGVPGVLGCVQTDADGDADATVPLPSKSVATLPAGVNTIVALAGTACGTGTELPARAGIAATFQLATFGVTSAQHVPGGTVSVALTGFTKAPLAGGQQVAIKADGGWNSPVLACVETNIMGAGTATFTLPADAPLGTFTLNALAGTKCGAGSEAPGRSLQTPLTVTAAPPVVTPPVVTPPVVTPPVVASDITVSRAAKVSGAFKVGKKVKVAGLVLSEAGASLKYQWLRNGKAIKKATKATYKVVKADRKKKLSVRITATKSGFKTLTVTTAAKKVR